MEDAHTLVAINLPAGAVAPQQPYQRQTATFAGFQERRFVSIVPQRNISTSFQQCFDARLAAALHSVQERGGVSDVRSIDCGAGASTEELEQKVGSGARSRVREKGPAVGRERMDVGAGGHQKFEARKRTLLASEREGRQILGVLAA